jgi:ubiquinone biosynthesis protein
MSTLMSVALHTIWTFTRVKLVRGDPVVARAHNARRLRLAFERLGATYIKLGQLLAMRPDYLSPEYVVEFQHLLDDVPAFPPDVAVRVLEEELNGNIQDLFLTFTGHLLGSASFAQVYEAKLHTGDRVAVKVQRPGIERLVRVDLKLMRWLVTVLDASALLLSIKLRPILNDFEAVTYQELDYRIEGRFANRLLINSDGDPFQVIPRVFWDLTTKHVLVVELLEGLWITDVLTAVAEEDTATLEVWEADGLDLSLVARRILRTLLRQGLGGGGLFHADPHASNLVILDDNSIGLVDFGIVGFVGNDLREKSLRLLGQIGAGNASAAFHEMVQILEPRGGANLKAFKSEFSSLIEHWHNAASDPLAPLREKSTGRLLLATLNSMRKHGLHLPPNLALYFRALIIVDTIILRLDPQLDMSLELSLTLTELGREHLLETLTWDQYYTAALSYQKLLLKLPYILSELSDIDVGREVTRVKEIVLHYVWSVLLVVGGVVLFLKIRGITTFRISSLSISWSATFVLVVLSALFVRWWSRRVRSRG